MQYTNPRTHSLTVETGLYRNFGLQIEVETKSLAHERRLLGSSGCHCTHRNPLSVYGSRRGNSQKLLTVLFSNTIFNYTITRHCILVLTYVDFTYVSLNRASFHYKVN